MVQFMGPSSCSVPLPVPLLLNGPFVFRVLARAPGHTTLADLYDPGFAPANLRKAHRALDVAVDRLYRPAPFGSDRERVEHLFGLYERMVSGFLATPSKPKRGRRAGAV